LRTNSFALSVMLLVQYGLGMGVNLYARVPAAGQGAGIIAALGRALTSQPVVLAVHAGLGLLMLVAGSACWSAPSSPGIGWRSRARRPAWPR
jgi:hypothetical protein